MRHFILAVTMVAVALPSLAEEKPPPSPIAGFDIKQVQPPDPQQGTPVARLFEDYLYPADVKADSPKLTKEQADRLVGIIFGKLRERYQVQHKLAATQEEIDQFAAAMRKSRRDREGDEVEKRDAEEQAAAWQSIGKVMVEGWKIDRLLYKTYGGTVIFQQGNPLEPVGAYRQFLEAAEGAKLFKIYDEENRKLFWYYFVRKHPFEIKEKVNFDQPWWLQKPD